MTGAIGSSRFTIGFQPVPPAPDRFVPSPEAVPTAPVQPVEPARGVTARPLVSAPNGLFVLSGQEVGGAGGVATSGGTNADPDGQGSLISRAQIDSRDLAATGNRAVSGTPGITAPVVASAISLYDSARRLSEQRGPARGSGSDLTV